MEIKLIKNKKEHLEALKAIESLMDIDPEPGTKKGNHLELLSSLVEKYEKEHFPIDNPTPIEAIQFRMEQQGLKQKDLAPYIGSPSKVSEVLSEKRPLTLRMIRNLVKGLGIPANVILLKKKDKEDTSHYNPEMVEKQ